MSSKSIPFTEIKNSFFEDYKHFLLINFIVLIEISIFNKLLNFNRGSSPLFT